MPTYDYRCDACGHVFSKIQRWSDPPLTRCPNCGARPRRLVSVPAIVFKGSGFHVTDYRPKSGDASSDGAAAKDAAKKDSTKTDSTKKEDAPAKSDGSSS